MDKNLEVNFVFLSKYQYFSVKANYKMKESLHFSERFQRPIIYVGIVIKDSVINDKRGCFNWECNLFSFLIPHSFSTIPVGGGQAGALP